MKLSKTWFQRNFAGTPGFSSCFYNKTLKQVSISRAPLWVFHIILFSSLHVALTSRRANPKPSPMRAWWLASPSARGICWKFGTKFGILSIVVFSCQAPCQAFVPYPWASSFAGKIRIKMSGYLPDRQE